jgi:trehalose-phosphatase
MQANKLKTELEQALAPFNVQVQHDRGEVEIVPKQMHKGRVVKQILEQQQDESEGLPPDFILVIGDDVSDEKMFSSVLSYVAGTAVMLSSSRESGDENPLSRGAEAMLSMGEEQYMSSPRRQPVAEGADGVATRSARSQGATTSAFLDSGRVFTCTVGKKPSIAGCFVETVTEVHHLLATLTRE